MKALFFFVIALAAPAFASSTSTSTDSSTWDKVDHALSQGAHDASEKVDKSLHEKPKKRKHSVGEDLDHAGDELNRGWDKALDAVGIEKKKPAGENK